MATQILNTFNSYTLSEQEQLAGSMYTYEQKLFIQNQIALIAEEKLNIVPDSQNYSSFIQQEAHLAGQLHILKYLLDCSTASEQLMLDKIKENEA